jgi:O-antigen ligase
MSGGHPSVVQAAARRFMTAGVVVIAAARLLVRWSPGYDLDATAVGPAGGAMIDLACVALLGGAVVLNVLARRRVSWGLLSAGLIAAIVALTHGANDPPSLRLGGSWAASIALGLAAMHLGRDAESHRRLAAGFIALLVPLGLGAIHQVAVVQPASVAYYEQQKAAGQLPPDLAADPRKFEQRLYQREATGRLPFANVFGSVAMALMVLAIGPLAERLRLGARTIEGDDPGRGAVGLAAGLGAIGAMALLLSGSKGAMLAGAIALMFQAGLRGITGRRAGWAALAVAGIGVAAVAVRGGVWGEWASPQGERSLLFRWHYWQGAARMWAEHPWLGVGPGRFQEFYFITKNPFSPEDVTDPHNALIAWVATLGLAGGAAWAALLGMMLWRAGRDAAAPPHPAAGADPQARRWASGIACVVVAVQVAVEWPMFTPDLAAVWLLGAVGFAWVMHRAMHEAWVTPSALAAAATGIVLHAQIEMNLTQPMAAPLLLAILGLAAAGRSGTALPVESSAVDRLVAPPLAALMAGLWLMFHTRPVLETGVDPTPAAIARAVQLAGQERFVEAQGELIRARQRGMDLGALWRSEADLAFAAHQRTGERAWLLRAVQAAEQSLRHLPYDLPACLFAADLAQQAGLIDKARQLHRHVLLLDQQAHLDPLKQLTPADRARVQAAAR